MLCIHLKEEDPWFCLAAEEFLLKNYTDDVFMIWQSHNTVVAGKHQNMLGEVNYRYVREHGIRLARRISGGARSFTTGEMSISPISFRCRGPRRSVFPASRNRSGRR